MSDEFRPEDWADIDYEQEAREEGPSCRSLSETRPRARKEHTCTVCKGVIEIGELYRRSVAIDDEGDGSLFTDKLCMGCEVLHG